MFEFCDQHQAPHPVSVQITKLIEGHSEELGDGIGNLSVGGTAA